VTSTGRTETCARCCGSGDVPNNATWVRCKRCRLARLDEVAALADAIGEYMHETEQYQTNEQREAAVAALRKLADMAMEGH
jgi:hypothetical protein